MKSKKQNRSVDTVFIKGIQMKYMAAVATAVLLAVPSVFAADENGTLIVLGHGNKSCGTVVEDYVEDGTNKSVNSVWVSGYLTAMNEHVYQGKNVAKGTDPAARDLWIHNYCRENPLDNLYKATWELYLALRSR